MPDNSTEAQSLLVKVVVYVLGVSLGLAAKLAVIHKERMLTWKDIILHTAIAFAAAWLTWFALQQYHLDGWANVSAVIVGRFGDSILIMIWKGIKKALNSFINDHTKE